MKLWKDEPVSPSGGDTSLEMCVEEWLFYDKSMIEFPKYAVEPVMYDDNPSPGLISTNTLEDYIKDEFIKEGNCIFYFLIVI